MNTAALAPKCSFVLTYSCDQHQYKPPLEPSAFRVVHEYNNALKKKKKKQNLYGFPEQVHRLPSLKFSTTVQSEATLQLQTN